MLKASGSNTVETVFSTQSATKEALKSPDVLDKLDKGGAKATYLDSKAMRAQMAADNKMFADIIKRGNVTLQ